MNRDSFYFSHDCDATDDPKIMLLLSQWGLEAYGIYWTIIEHLRKQPEYKSHLSILRALASRFNSTEEKYKFVVLDFGLFKVEDNVFFYSESLINRMKPLEAKRTYMKELAEKRWANAHALPAHSVRNASKVKESKVKESKVKESKEINKRIKLYSDEIKNFTGSLTSFFPKDLVNRISKNDKWQWVDTIDKLIRIDKYDKETIEKAVKLARDDNFWSKNFLSLCKLRKPNKDGVKHINVFLELGPKEVNDDAKIDETMKLYIEKYGNENN
jgi:hypothetical protein